MAKTREYAFVYLFGGIMYGLMEVIWRGHTHWTMTLTGGTALLILYIINIKMSNCNIFLKCLIGASAITLLEFTVGVIINIILKWNVWDYSNRPLNILGQVCPLFFFFSLSRFSVFSHSFSPFCFSHFLAFSHCHDCLLFHIRFLFEI